MPSPFRRPNVRLDLEVRSGPYFPADDVNVQLGSGAEDTVHIDGVGVADDMLIRGQGGVDSVYVSYTHVGDRADINTGSGDSYVNIYNSEFGGTQLIGGSSADYITATAGNGASTDLGFKPRVTTGNGDDTVILGGDGAGFFDETGGGGVVLVSGRLFINAGSGDDDAYVDVHGGGDDYSYNINMVAGDDILDIFDDLDPGDLINCGAGDDDLSLDSGASANIRNCEEVSFRD